MIWIGPLVGAALLSRGGVAGMLAGSLLGGWVERRWRERNARPGGRRRGAAEPPRRDAGGPLADAYRTLGVAPRASDGEVRRAYRAKAKACHPDALRARGAAESEVAAATERMARVNAAWSAIRAARGI